MTNESPPRTVACVLTSIRDLGCIVGYDNDIHEYSIRVPGLPFVSTYFTDDPDDALATAKLMIQEAIANGQLKP